jgi:biopolymer transport protein ExbB/TolQ
VDESNQAVVHALPAELVGTILRASGRTAAAVSDEMNVGLDSLATIASVAPWIGLFGTFMGIENSFGELPGEKSACMAAIADRISGSMWTTALGLLVGLTSLWCYKYLTGRLETCRWEMECAPLELVNQLSRYRGRWHFEPTNTRVVGESMFGERPRAN